MLVSCTCVRSVRCCLARPTIRDVADAPGMVAAPRGRRRSDGQAERRTAGAPDTDRGPADLVEPGLVVPPGMGRHVGCDRRVGHPRDPGAAGGAAAVLLGAAGRHGECGPTRRWCTPGVAVAPRHPGSTAVNWGGYRASGQELHGSDSALRSATGNPNTRDFSWSPGRPYRLSIERVVAAAGGPVPAGVTAWRGSVQDLHSGEDQVVRDLYMEGDSIVGVTMWSEVFARCDDPTVSVRWSRPVVHLPDRDVEIAEGRGQLPGRHRRRLHQHRRHGRRGGRRATDRGRTEHTSGNAAGPSRAVCAVTLRARPLGGSAANAP